MLQAGKFSELSRGGRAVGQIDGARVVRVRFQAAGRRRSGTLGTQTGVTHVPGLICYLSPRPFSRPSSAASTSRFDRSLCGTSRCGTQLCMPRHRWPQRTLGRKRGIVTAMDVESALKAVVTNTAPAATGTWIGIALTCPRELYERRAASLAKSAIEGTTNRSELEFADHLVAEFDEGWYHKVQILRPPHLHFTDSPIARKLLWSSSSGHSPYLFRHLTYAVARAPAGEARAAVCTRRNRGVRRADRGVRTRACQRCDVSHGSVPDTSAAVRCARVVARWKKQ